MVMDRNAVDVGFNEIDDDVRERYPQAIEFDHLSALSPHKDRVLFLLFLPKFVYLVSKYKD